MFYLPVILLVFPLWFKLFGLVDGIIGAVVCGLFVESLKFAARIEAVTTFIIYTLNWIFMPNDSLRKAERAFLHFSEFMH